LVNILRHIDEELKGNIPLDFNTWLDFYEIGPKTASLLFHAAFGKFSTLPTDSHVWYAFNKLKWTNARYRDECSWQTSCWMVPEYFIKTNDTIGSLRQTLADNRSRPRIILLAQEHGNPRLAELIQLLE
jgi:endonuclease III